MSRDIFIQLAANEKSVAESVAFSDIARSLMDEQPDVFGTPAMREAFQDTHTPPFGMPDPTSRPE